MKSLTFFAFTVVVATVAFAAETTELPKSSPAQGTPPQPPSQMPMMMPPPGAQIPPAGPIPLGGPQAAAPSQQITEDFMKMVMEASAKIEAAKNKIQQRQAHLMVTVPEILKLQAQLANMQKKINAIIESDTEYAALRLKRDIMATVMPDLPKPPAGPMGGPMGAPMGGRSIMPPPTMRMPPAQPTPAAPPK